MPLFCINKLFPTGFIFSALIGLDFKKKGILQNVDQGDKLFFAQYKPFHGEMVYEQNFTKKLKKNELS